MSNRARTPAQRLRTADSTSTGIDHPSESRKTNKHSNHNSRSNNGDGFLSNSSPANGSSSSDKYPPRDDDVTAHSSLLQPRVAVVLGVSKTWHPFLFVCRLLSIAPAIWWGCPSVLRLLAMLHLLFFGENGGIMGSSNSTGAGTCAGNPLDVSFEARLRLTETLLATIWVTNQRPTKNTPQSTYLRLTKTSNQCGASGFLSFFFTDCLMSRWLLTYTPQATLVRLLAISATNAYLTSCALWVTGGSSDPRLLLPAWIAISTTLTIIYHLTQRKINIRKETRMSTSVFSIASFISMVALLAQLHSNRSDYPQIPLLTLIKRVWHEVARWLLAS